MADFGDDDPLSVAVRARGNLATATQPGQGALDISPVGTPLTNIRGFSGPQTGGRTVYRDVTQPPEEQSFTESVGGLGGLHERRQQIANELQVAHPRSGYANSLLAELHSIDRAQQGIEFEANQRRQMAHENAQESYKQLSIDRETEIDEQGHSLLQRMGYLDAALRKGNINKDEYDSALLEAGERYPLASRHPEAAKHFEFAITEADKQNAFRARREFAEASKLGGRYGIGVQADPETGLPSLEHTRAAALQTDKGRLEATQMMNREMFQKYGVPTGVGSLFNPIEPHKSPDEGKSIELPYVEGKTGKTAKVTVPMETFNAMKSDFQDRYFALNPPAQPAGAVQPQAAPVRPTIETGARRTIGGQLAEWDGKGWLPVQQ